MRDVLEERVQDWINDVRQLIGQSYEIEETITAFAEVYNEETNSNYSRRTAASLYVMTIEEKEALLSACQEYLANEDLKQ